MYQVFKVIETSHCGLRACARARERERGVAIEWLVEFQRWKIELLGVFSGRVVQCECT